MSLLPVQIPSGFTIVVKSGDTVSSGQVIARRNENAHEKHIPLATLLGVSSKKAASLLKKTPGDSVRIGEIIAVRASFVTLTEVVSSMAGTFVRYDTQTGEMIVEKAGEEESGPSEIVSPFDGVVAESQDTQVILNTKSGGLVGLRGTGGSSEGMLLLAESTDVTPVEGVHVVVEMIGNIVLGKRFTKEALVKASGMGVSGIITLTISDEDIAELEQKRMLLPLLEVDAETWETLAKQIGKKVYLDSVAKTILIS